MSAGETPRRTTCPYCGVGCGVLATPGPDGQLGIAGDPDHPANFGRLCSKGSALGATIGLDERLLTPVVHGAVADWETALGEVASRFRQTIADHGPDAVAFYVSGQLLTEDYYLANKLMKGFIGSANIDTNSRLCMASTVAGHKRAFGSDTVPGTYEDLELADLVVLAGSNLAWCHPVLYQRLAAAKASRPEMRIVVIDPRRTVTCDIADMHLALAPSTDVALWNGLLGYLADTGGLDETFMAHLTGLEEAVSAARADDPGVTGLGLETLAAFYALWAGTEKVVTVFSQGLNQSSSGTDKVNALLNCHLATGRIGKPGMGPFSVTGQPNAMGGRETGGLANMLACHLDLENAAHRATVGEFWGVDQLPDAPGLKAVDMFDAVGDGRIKALWIMCTNPVVSLPEADKVRAAIEGCDFVAVSDVTGATDTARLADVFLPATGWGEKNGTVTNSDRTISRQRGVLPVPGEARHDWDIIAAVGRRMGWEAAFDYAGPADVFREYAELSGRAGALGRDFDISALADLTDEGYDALEPTRWPVTQTRKGGRFFADGQFFTPDRKGRMIAVTNRDMATPVSAAYPFRLNTGRVRDQWHTMTRTGLAPRLSAHIAEPYLEIAPGDAATLGFEPATIAAVTSPHGQALLRVLVTDRVQEGHPFAPMHWTGETSSAGRVDALVTAAVDPISGQPESKASPVAIHPWKAQWYAYAVSRAKPQPETGYWARARIDGAWQIECAALTSPEDAEAAARKMLGVGEDAEVIALADPARGTHRFAFLEEGVLVAALFGGTAPVGLSRSLLNAAIGEATDSQLLAGVGRKDMPDPGATVCACLGIGINTITAAVAGEGLGSVEAITDALGAGGECGSCKPELSQILAAHGTPLAAE